ncbi:MAG: hypothetical protein HN411_03920 [Waddliaceae bacterium]|jgi:Zn finger protein HypA/HybF involved in hydrogenase expression|nr:hypothetical protein [Waddliaceae bacterium]MBT3579208.1 hypothetical protein [Waddliaceae bacterium]MBT4444733.1 hypothetical protein [Waddliaceae bacterium]MBT6928907.1 hypothetical protein [Waddliaceae bacterium]MBT7264154.1 hypothetical protein [Waddliaceae bacterium]
MIEITSATAFTFYLALTLGVVFGLVLYHHFKKKDNTTLPFEKNLIVCEYCRYTYLEEITVELTKCPQCHSLNKANTPSE